MHKLTIYLAKNHNPPPSPPGRGARGVGEDLNVSGMMSNHKLAKAALVYGVLRVLQTGASTSVSY
ncbi:hypothetical protein [Okeania sp. KiyG1]|uniref:hypothetical protein n=1 Tax=Okeania sp. KiyG1 TaxID=2720165 RepID=UPI001F39B673|nr:hypothetical protein [Okeania sp. KiyG1]